MNNPDRLYELLPVVHRQRDAEGGYPLRALLRVIAEQVGVVEDDISRLYDNWFIETCEDWVVPYLGDLIGYQLVHEAGEPGEVRSLEGRALNKILVPRREIANTIRYRRRKGTLALLEQLASDAAGWPGRAVEFYRRLGVAQPINQLRLKRGRTVDVREGNALDLIDGPFDSTAHTVDVRRINSHRAPGRYNLPGVGVFVWRLRSYSVSRTPACCLEEVGPQCYSFSVLGNDAPLFARPEPEPAPTHIAEELNLPVPIRHRAFECRVAGDGESQAQASTDYYGPGKSVQIWAPQWSKYGDLIPARAIIPADLTAWQYRPQRDFVSVDPVLGRVVFPPGQLPPKGVWVAYQYGFSADIGGGEYSRPLSQPVDFKLYQVGPGQQASLRDALDQWRKDQPENAVIEITASGVYVEQLNVELGSHQTLQLRAANRVRPVIRLLDWQTNLPDALSVTGQEGSRFTLDGLLITGRGVFIRGARGEVGNTARTAEGQGNPVLRCGDVEVVIRHCTLVPGWGLQCDCEPKRPSEPSLELFNLQGRIVIEHSIIGSIQVQQDEVRSDPIEICISDSVLDATSPEREALGAPGAVGAHAFLTVTRCTVFGSIQTHAIRLAENSLFVGNLCVARRQIGCVRFCYVTPGSRAPRRYHCQPDLAERAAEDQLRTDDQAQNRPPPSTAEIDSVRARERLRVEPRFNNFRYGTPDYCQLSIDCAVEILRGADDESEMGVFHDLFQPQRSANLRARLDEFTPAGMDAGIIYAS